MVLCTFPGDHRSSPFVLRTSPFALRTSPFALRTKTLARRYKQFVANSLDLEKFPAS